MMRFNEVPEDLTDAQAARVHITAPHNRAPNSIQITDICTLPALRRVSIDCAVCEPCAGPTFRAQHVLLLLFVQKFRAGGE